jgi:hypothetical protein
LEARKKPLSADRQRFYISVYLLSTRKWMDVFVNPSTSSCENEGMQTSSIPLGATYPRAIAMLFTAWLTALAPMATKSTCCSFLDMAAIAPATDFGTDEDDTFNVSIQFPPYRAI